MGYSDTPPSKEASHSVHESSKVRDYPKTPVEQRPNSWATVAAGQSPLVFTQEDQSSSNPTSQNASQSQVVEKAKTQAPPEDHNTCRICRQEESKEEPLFYPCRCSGSIKFVHQACLVSWLSHTQKKHCELCRTTFRFTKLYSPSLSRGVPVFKFLRQVFIHVWRTLCTWLRIGLVATVWLALFPWTMRCIWRGLFWLVEGGWVDQQSMESISAADATSATNGLSMSNHSGSWPWFSDTSTKNATVSQGFVHATKAFVTSLSHLIIATLQMIIWGDGAGPLVYVYLKSVIAAIHAWTVGEAGVGAQGQPPEMSFPDWRMPPSWLSGVTYLQKLTPSKKINLVIVDILEGQLITLSIIVTFVLLFLIREWVINQELILRNARRDQPAENPNRVRGQVDLVAPPPPDTNDAHTEPRVGFPEQRQTIESGTPNTQPNTPTIHPQHGSNLEERENNHFVLEEKPTMRDRALEIMRRRLADSQDLDDESATGIRKLTELLRDPTRSPRDVARTIRDQGLEELFRSITKSLERSEENPNDSIVSDNMPLSGNPSEAKRPAEENRSTTANDERPTMKAEDKSGTPIEPTPLADVAAASLEVNNSEESSDNDPNMQQSFLEDQNLESQILPSSEEGSNHAEAAMEERADRHPEARPQSLLDDILDWLWGDLIPQIGPHTAAVHDQEQAPLDPQAEAPLVPARADPVLPEPNAAVERNQVQDPEVLAAAREAGIEPAALGENIEDFEDMEGIMELIGVHGPLEGLFQNAMFCALLVSVALILGVWLPFIVGTSFVTTVSDPVLFLFKGPALLLSFIADTLVDGAIVIVGWSFYLVHTAIRHAIMPVYIVSPKIGNFLQDPAAGKVAISQVGHAAQRLSASFIQPSGEARTIDFAVISAIEHQALLTVESAIVRFIVSIAGSLRFVLEQITTEDASTLVFAVWTCTRAMASSMYHLILQVTTSGRSSLGALSNFTPLRIRIPISHHIAPVDLSLVHWNTRDRSVAILFGYLSLTLIGAAYVHIRHWLEGKPRDDKIKGAVADFLYQMGGVLKVILIIGIEMIIFPLYCGVLLDAALLPLFQHASIPSRMSFTRSNLITSLFVHWFIGTSYMFHFALFVATCRKQMRAGVLYFIKDPDDPDFHPVRDVLERNLVTQLRKICSSALIYGSLILLGLGGVVYGMNYMNPNILPIRWVSSNVMSDVPVNLMFYNILVPIIVKLFRPTKAWNTVFAWWFRRCGSWLRLSNFLFGTKKPEEQGRHICRTWRDYFRGERGDVENPVLSASPQIFEEQEDLRAYFLWNGNYVRAPGSDSVKPPKGHPAFLYVDQHNKRLDSQEDRKKGCHGSEDPKWTMIYIPPHFRFRLAALLVTVWLFLAIAGCSVTVLPLVLGRFIVGTFIKNVEGMSDIYAFSIGVTLLPLPIYIYNHRQLLQTQMRSMQSASLKALSAHNFVSAANHTASLLYFYTTLLIIFPLLLSLIVQTYILIPSHTYFSLHDAFPSILKPATESLSTITKNNSSHLHTAPPFFQQPPNHTIHLLQDWTLGLLYLRLIIKHALSQLDSRFARAIRVVIPPTHIAGENGNAWCHPNLWAFTRIWVFPVMILAADLLLSPLAMGWVLTRTDLPRSIWNAIVYVGLEIDDPVMRDAVLRIPDDVLKTLVYRFSYTAVVAFFVGLVILMGFVHWFQGWKKRIRDEVYLIGERLHNYTGERNKKRKTHVRAKKGKGKEKEIKREEKGKEREFEVKVEHQGNDICFEQPSDFPYTDPLSNPPCDPSTFSGDTIPPFKIPSAASASESAAAAAADPPTPTSQPHQNNLDSTPAAPAAALAASADADPGIGPSGT